ncbi:MAG: ABC transporter permease [Patescibacteria group bacterium]|nr:ABC transporter permease [Patescibacteria group bacterium]
MSSFYQLFLANFKMFYREKEGFYWTVLMPAFIYTALSIIPIGKIINSQTVYSSFVLPGIIAMTIMQGGIYSLAYWMVDLKARGVTKRLLATPLKQWQLVVSLVCARLVIVVMQAVILTLLGVLAFRAQFAGNIISSFLLIVAGGAIFLLVGLLIANYANSYDSAAPITSAVGLPLTFLSSVFYPLSVLPEALQKIAKILPITYLAEGLRTAYLSAFDLKKIAFDLAILGIWLAALLLITVKVFKLKE